MFNRILVPVDGSPCATAALLQAIEIVKIFHGSITVVAVYNAYPYIVAASESGYTQSQFIDAFKAEANANVQNAAKLASEAGVQLETLVQESAMTWRGILDAAASSQSDLIVMGSHGRSGMSKLVIGSVTQSVLQRTKLPVLVVRQ